MKVSRLSGLLAVALLSLGLTGCGDTFRPVVNPIVSPLPDPATHGLAVTVNTAGSTTCVGGVTPPCPAGSVTQINVTGDSPAPNPQAGGFGIDPVHAIFVPSGLNTFARVVMANKGSDNVSVYSPDSTAPASLISMGAGAAPVFVASTPDGSKVYVANSGNGTVGVITPLTIPPVLAGTITVGGSPRVLAVTPDGTKVYVANADGSATVIATATNAVGTPFSAPAGTVAPAWAVANSAGTAIYVLYPTAGKLDVIDLTVNPNAFSPTELTVDTGSNYMAFDGNMQRLYVNGTAGVYVFDTHTPVPTALSTVSLPAAQPAVSLTALPNGTSVYVATNATTGCNNGEANSGRAYVINASSLATPTTCVTVGANPVWMASSFNSQKVYVAHQGTNPGTTIISGTTPVTDLPSPFTDPACDPGTATCFRESPVFVMANP